MRSMVVDENAVLAVELNGVEIMRKKLRNVAPPEMISVNIDGKLTQAGGELRFSLLTGGEK